MSKWITLTIEVIIFTALIGTIASSVANPNGNISGAALVVYSLITLIIIAGFIAYLSKQMGLSKR